jgi:hypothetical protein
LRGEAPAEWQLALALALVAAAEDGHPAAAGEQGLGEEFDHRRLAGAADGDVADADDRHTEVVVVQVALAVEKEAQAHGARIDPREQAEGRTQQGRSDATLVVDDHLDEVGFEIFQGVFHPGPGAIHNPAARPAQPFACRLSANPALPRATAAAMLNLSHREALLPDHRHRLHERAAAHRPCL